MNLQQFILAIVCLFVGALISFFITTLTQRKVITQLAKDILLTHEKVHHKQSTIKLIEKHENNCLAKKGYNALHAGMIFLIIKQGGDPKDLGLIL